MSQLSLFYEIKNVNLVYISLKHIKHVLLLTALEYFEHVHLFLTSLKYFKCVPSF